jgi:hypothetical protein
VSGTFSIVDALPTVVVPYGSTWEYLDNAAPPAGWETTTGGGWQSGPAQLGYGNGDEATVLFDTSPNIPTVYFRRSLMIDRPVTAASLKVLYDDGYAAYVNGVLVADQNVANGVAHDTFASAGAAANNSEETTNLDLTTNPFVVGNNVIAVLVKQSNGSSSDVSFDLELTLTREPIMGSDECALGIDDCDDNATCADTAGSFTCTCNPGYGGDGRTCTPTTTSDDGGSVMLNDAGMPIDDAGNPLDLAQPAVTPSQSGGCGCRLGRAGAAPSALTISVLLALLLVRRRFTAATARRRGGRSGSP